VNPINILAQYDDLRSKTFNILVEHGKQVAQKTLAAAQQVPELKPDANKFFSKNGKAQPAETSITEIIENLNRYGPDKVQRFESWVKMFE
jgi:hypothetical protein